MHLKSSRPRFLVRNVKRNPTTGGKLRDLRASRQQVTARDAAHAPGTRPTVGKIGTDLFTISGRDYLVTVDYFSNFYEIDFLADTLSETAISKPKNHFVRHGIPDTVISDNGPQFSSEAFRNFAEKWEFDHERISPGNSKANGAAKAAVKDAKKMMKRCRAEKSDPFIGLLNVRNTPSEGMLTSPAQRLFGRRTKTTTPTTGNLLQLKYDVADDRQPN